jgi:hypothetical protein
MLLSSYTLKFLFQLIQLDAAGFQLLYIRLIDSPPPPSQPNLSMPEAEPSADTKIHNDSSLRA